jgi:cyclophilin family peptidyl-prolyl cis-trans isomerase
MSFIKNCGEKLPVKYLNIKSLSCFLACFFLFISVLQAAEPTRVRMHTSLGNMEIELNVEKSPRTVKNFLNYVNSRYYEGLIFHRVISGWLIQGGGYDEELSIFETDKPVRNEATNGLKNVRGTIAMARHWDPNSADSQFFINLKDNASFDHQSRSPRGYGYAVFGKIISGMDVADAIGNAETHVVEEFDKDVPVETIFIKKVEVID